MLSLHTLGIQLPECSLRAAIWLVAPLLHIRGKVKRYYISATFDVLKQINITFKFTLVSIHLFLLKSISYFTGFHNLFFKLSNPCSINDDAGETDTA